MMHEKKDAFAADDMLLTAKEAAGMLRMDIATLANMRARGEGPPWIKLESGAVRYSMHAILEWINAGSRGLTWQRVANALEAFDGMTPAERNKLLAHLRSALKDG